MPWVPHTSCGLIIAFMDKLVKGAGKRGYKEESEKNQPRCTQGYRIFFGEFQAFMCLERERRDVLNLLQLLGIRSCLFKRLPLKTF